MNLHQCFLTENKCYKSGKKIKPKGVMVHSTGANNPTLKRYVQPDDGLLGKNPNGNHWNQYTPGGSSVCVHAFIGKLKDGSIATYQTLPWDMRGWHSGSGKKGSANNGYIGFEICEDGLTDSKYFNRVYKEAVELTAYLCDMYNLEPQKDGVVICHKEGYQRGISSGHADVLHWFPKHGKNMDDFRSDVAKQMKGDEVDMTKEEVQAIIRNAVGEAEARLNKNMTTAVANAIKPKNYNKLNEVPGWGLDAVKHFMDAGKLKGDQNGNLNLSEDLLRALVVIYR